MDIAETISYLGWIDVIGRVIWIFLTALMVVVTFNVYMREGQKSLTFRFGLILIVMIWLYPAYTNFDGNMMLGQIASLLTLVMSVIFLVVIRRHSIRLSTLLIPQVVWLGIASLYLGLQLSVQ